MNLSEYFLKLRKGKGLLHEPIAEQGIITIQSSFILKFNQSNSKTLKLLQVTNIFEYTTSLFFKNMHEGI